MPTSNTLVRESLSLMNPLAAGDMLDHYRIDATVARGGMSTLYRATDTRTQKPVAIKLPHDEMQADHILSERFKREEEIGCQLDHPGIVKTFIDAERSSGYMVLEWCDGILLRQILNSAPLDFDRARKLISGICDALDYMHKRGVVHRDLKPENIMVNTRDEIKLLDFGIAMKEDARRLTYADMSPAMGTPDYISPEQVQGKRGDQRSDIYALGIIFYEMLTGHVPFEGANPLAVMNERLLTAPKSARKQNPAVTAELQEVLNRALERDPRHRYDTAAKMIFDLEHPEQLGLESTGRRPAMAFRMPKRNMLLLYGALVALPLLLFALMLALAHH